MEDSTKRSPLAISVIFATIVVDLIGFGIIIPLVGLYGQHFGASGVRLAILGAAYSATQFIFAPLWGALSDHVGRRPVLLGSIGALSFSYFLFAFADSFELLLISRLLGGVFAANIGTAQAYIADITAPEKRAQGMALLGAAFGIGFVIGPPLGGMLAAHYSLATPGLVAGALSLLNFVSALFFLPESLPVELRRPSAGRSLIPLSPAAFKITKGRPELLVWMVLFFLVTFSFSNFEQTFTLLVAHQFELSTAKAAYQAGLVLMVMGLVSVLMQGGVVRRLLPRVGETKMLLVGLLLYAVSMTAFPFLGSLSAIFVVGALLACGNSCIGPTTSALMSKCVGASDQGAVFGLSQGLASLARALGPLFGLSVFALDPSIPFLSGALISAGLAIVVGYRLKRT